MKFCHYSTADNFSLLDQLVSTADTTVFHLASHSNQKAVAADPHSAADNITGLTDRLASYCKTKQLRLIYISSSMVYGDWINNKAVEAQPLAPTNPYGQYKMQAEQVVRSVLPNNHIIIRPSAVYGARDSDDRVISRWVNAARSGDPIQIDDPNVLLDFTYVKDLVKGIEQAGRAKTTGTFNMTSGDPQTLLEAATIINTKFGNRSEIIMGKGLPKDQPRRGALDNSFARAELGWQPTVGFAQGVDTSLND
jgi:nucleoside-diphosphate-sugar epimerase